MFSAKSIEAYSAQNFGVGYCGGMNATLAQTS
jgi:hypothetical protein